MSSDIIISIKDAQELGITWAQSRNGTDEEIAAKQAELDHCIAIGDTGWADYERGHLEWLNEYSYTASIPGYAYTRVVDINETDLQFNCGGEFRRWFQVYLKSRGVPYVIY